MAELGLHNLLLVIDSPNHLAAKHGEEAGASSQPLVASRLASRGGISLTGLNQTEIAAGIVIKEPTHWKARRWNRRRCSAGGPPSEGYTNSIFTPASGVETPWEADEPAPILLVARTSNGTDLFPSRNSTWTLRIVTESNVPIPGSDAAEGLWLTTVDVAVPENPGSAWGSTTAFWVANDGATYFTKKLHLSADFSGGPDAGIALIDMPASDATNKNAALDDVGGSVLETDDVLNNRALASITLLPKTSDLGISLPDEPLAATPGETIRIDAKVTNDGETVSQYLPRATDDPSQGCSLERGRYRSSGATRLDPGLL